MSLYRIASVITLCPLFDAAHATTRSINYQTTYCNSFSTIFSLGLAIYAYLNIRQNRNSWVPPNNTLLGLGYLVQWSVTQDDFNLIVTSPFLYLVHYNLCNEPWSRKCIKRFGSEVTNIVFILELIQTFVYSNLQKSPPKCGKSQNRPHNAWNRPLGVISPPLNTTGLDCLRKSHIQRRWYFSLQ